MKGSGASCAAAGSVEHHVCAAEEESKPPGMPDTLHDIGTAQGQQFLVCPGKPGALGDHWPHFLRPWGRGAGHPRAAFLVHQRPFCTEDFSMMILCKPLPREPPGPSRLPFSQVG